jgi:mannosyltransferase
MIRLPLRYKYLLSLSALPLISLMALSLRLYRLGFESIWLDEAQSVLFSALSPGELYATLTGDIHPPLYYFFMHFWSQLGEGEFWLRLPSVLSGTASVPLLYLIGHKLFGRRVGLTAALLLALNPLHVYYSQEMRSFTCGVFLMLAALVLLLRAVDKPDLKNLAGFAGATVLTAYTHYLPVLPIMCAMGAALIDLGINRGKEGRATMWRIIYAGAVSAALFFPWLPTMLKQISGGGGSWVEMISGDLSLKQLVKVLYEFLCGKVKPQAAGTVVAVVIGGGSLAAFLPWGGRDEKRRGAELYLVALFVLPVLISIILSLSRNMFIARYLIAILPGFLLAIACGLHKLPRLPALVYLMLIILLFTVALDHTYNRQDKPDWRGRTRQVMEQAWDDDTVMFYTGWAQSPFSVYRQWQGDNKPLKIVSFRDLPRQADHQMIVNLFGPNITKIARRSRRMWFFDIHRFRYDKKGLTLDYMKTRFPVLEYIKDEPRVYLFDLTRPRF